MNFIPCLKKSEQNFNLFVHRIMKQIVLLLIPICIACVSESKDHVEDPKVELFNEIINGQKDPKCPKNHTDSIIPIVYGYPSEELFAKSDSGLVALGGCGLSDENWYCKIHKISFK